MGWAEGDVGSAQLVSHSGLFHGACLGMVGSQGLEKEGLTLKTGYRVSPAYSTRKFYHLEFAWKGSILGFSVLDHEITRDEV